MILDISMIIIMVGMLITGAANTISNFYIKF